MSLFSGESKSKTENIQSEEIKILATNLEVLNRLLSKTGVQDNSNQGEDPILLQKIQQLQEKILYVEKAYKDENLEIYQKLKESFLGLTNLIKYILMDSRITIKTCTNKCCQYAHTPYTMVKTYDNRVRKQRSGICIYDPDT